MTKKAELERRAKCWNMENDTETNKLQCDDETERGARSAKGDE